MGMVMARTGVSRQRQGREVYQPRPGGLARGEPSGRTASGTASTMPAASRFRLRAGWHGAGFPR